MPISDLIPISEIRNYIAQLTGILVSKNAIKRWFKSGEIKLIQPPNINRRKKYTTKREILRFVKKYAEKKEPELSKELKSYSR